MKFLYLIAEIITAILIIFFVPIAYHLAAFWR
jgi:hypothetical protein